MSEAAAAHGAGGRGAAERQHPGEQCGASEAGGLRLLRAAHAGDSDAPLDGKSEEGEGEGEGREGEIVYAQYCSYLYIFVVALNASDAVARLRAGWRAFLLRIRSSSINTHACPCPAAPCGPSV